MEVEKRRKVEDTSEVQCLIFPCQASLPRLPDVIQLMIFAKLRPADLLSVGQTCKDLYKPINDSATWRQNVKKWTKDSSFILIAQARRSKHKLYKLGLPWHREQRNTLRDNVEAAMVLGKDRDSFDKDLFLFLLSTDKALFTTTSTFYQDARKAELYIKFSYQLVTCSCQLWKKAANQEAFEYSNKFWRLRFPTDKAKCHHLHIFCKILQSTTSYICKMIAADVLDKLSQDSKLDVWSLVEDWFRKFARFLQQWGKVELIGGCVNKYITRAENGRSDYKSPALAVLGRLAFRAQVLLQKDVKRSLVQELKSSAAQKRDFKDPSSAKARRVFLRGFCLPDFPKSKKSGYHLSIFLKTYQIQ